MSSSHHRDVNICEQPSACALSHPVHAYASPTELPKLRFIHFHGLERALRRCLESSALRQAMPSGAMCSTSLRDKYEVFHTIFAVIEPMARGVVFFILVFTISAIGLNPTGKNSIRIALASLSVQLPLYKYVTESVDHGGLHISHLDYLYVINALCQIFVVRILAPFLLSWVLTRLYAMFPNVVLFLVRAMSACVASALGVTDTVARNWIQFVLKTSEAYARFMNPVMKPVSATEIMMSVKQGASVKQEASTLLGMAVFRAPLFFIIPSEITKYYILTYAVEYYPLGKTGSKCRNIIIMAVMVSMPIANAEIVTTWPSLAGGVFNPGEWHRLTLSARALAIVGVYVSCMLSCVMLGVRIAQNAILKRKYRTWTIRLSSFALMWFAQVLTWLSTLDGVLEGVHQAMFSCTLLLILISTGLSVWSSVARLIADEQFITRQSSKMR